MHTDAHHRSWAAVAANRWGPAVVSAVAVAAAGLLAGAVPAAAQSAACTGNAIVQLAPYSCTSSRTIDGTVFTVVLSVGADRSVTVEYRLGAPRTVPTAIRLESHIGLSGGPPPEGRAEGVIPLGATNATLAVVLQCGQIDVKAVILGNGQPPGHVAAPFVTTASGCTSAPPGSPPSSSPTTVEATSVPATTSPTTSVPSAVLPTVALPSTGSSRLDSSLWLVLALLGSGATGIVVAARHRQRDAGG